mmetsp:Transcript_7359/g.14616  ORF Transcript_7359/g.14616 Transcript_7359/m.14616 type:complete len:151 (-) Transcript_7359:1179-1631(-)
MNLLVYGIVWYHILTHGIIFFCDFTQAVPLVDFVTRDDGTASDPSNLLPLELVYAGITAMSFGTVGAAFLLAFFGVGTIQSAAALSVIFHGMWTIHMSWRWDSWRAMMHPDAEVMSPSFFLTGHLLWTVSSLVLLRLTSSNTAPSQQKEE